MRSSPLHQTSDSAPPKDGRESQTSRAISQFQQIVNLCHAVLITPSPTMSMQAQAFASSSAAGSSTQQDRSLSISPHFVQTHPSLLYSGCETRSGIIRLSYEVYRPSKPTVGDVERSVPAYTLTVCEQHIAFLYPRPGDPSSIVLRSSKGKDSFIKVNSPEYRLAKSLQLAVGAHAPIGTVKRLQVRIAEGHLILGLKQ
jgi:hypothetical protein